MMINKERLIKHFCEMVAIDSEVYHEKNYGDYLVELLTEMGAEVYRDDCGKSFGGDCGNIVGFFKGELAGEPICFNAHIDTVKNGQGISAKVEEEYILSAGDTILGADDKAGVAVIFEALRAVREAGVPHRDLYAFFTVCEEDGLKGVKHFDYSRLPCKKVVSIDCAGSPAVVAVGGRAKYTYAATFVGKEAHGVLAPSQGIHGVLMAATAVTRLPIGVQSKDAVANVGKIEGGEYTHMVPERAMIRGEVRSFCNDEAENLLKKVRKICEDTAKEFGGRVEITTEHSYPALVLSEDAPLYQQMKEYLNREGYDIVPTILGGAGDCNVMCLKGYDCVIMGCGMTKVHTTEECLNIKEFCDTAKILTYFLL